MSNSMPGGRAAAFAYGAAYLATWGAATAYLYSRHADWTFPLISLGVFGVVLSGLAWALTRAARPGRIEVRRPRLELGAVLAYLAVYAIVFLGWGMGALREAVPAGQGQELVVLGVKLVVHVVGPALLLALLGARLGPLFGTAAAARGFWPTLLVLGLILLALLSLVSPSLGQIASLHPPIQDLMWAAPLAFAWLALEAGLCEEFLFRAVLQTRLSAVLRSEVGAVVIGALVFALCHVPGLYLRGAPGVDGYSTDLLQVIAFTVATLSPIALMFGLIWARTRNLLLVVLLHACVDVLPQIPDTLRIWAGLH
ncbi:CPBP family intramembrane glutamic endopeptidase [Phenylobacterium aquaticum]|uniref:CPBP family intramembrane glutamic endopeptidase n=1 Tax=Phenylobacterium aquaticum TaxID=1763816 RepID=UPI0026EE0A59|nr:CPBP family intramembrane glutamic endopeptidase [Phenylobacterium aquaticum]